MCFKGVLRQFQRCFKEDSRVRKCQVCFKKINKKCFSRIFQWSFVFQFCCSMYFSAATRAEGGLVWLWGAFLSACLLQLASRQVLRTKMKNNLWWKTTFDGRCPLVEHILWLWLFFIVTSELKFPCAFNPSKQSLCLLHAWYNISILNKMIVDDIYVCLQGKTLT